MISKEEVKHIAKLARLELEEKELDSFQQELSSILDYIENLKKLDVAQVVPTSHAVEIKNAVREDEGPVYGFKTAEKLTNSAPEIKDGYLKVKSIFK